MKIIVTGGAGFIGSNLCDRLIELGHEVIVIDNLSTGKFENLNTKVTFYLNRVESPECEKIFELHRPEIVYHLAAQADVRKSVADPIYDAQVNILGTINLLQLSVKYGVKKFIFISSGGVIYGNTYERPAKEDDKVAPESPYGIAKLTGEYYVKFYSQNYGLKYSILRYANVFGPRQNPFGEAGVCAIFAKNMLKGEPCILYGYGKMVRDYVYIDDVNDANILMLEQGDNEVFNVGKGLGTSVEELFNKMREIVGYKVEPILKPKRPGELDINVLDTTKLQKLGWQARVSFKDGLINTIEWVRKNYL